MLIQLNTDHNIEADAALAQQVDTIIRAGFERFSAQITRVDVHLSDENSDRKVGTGAKRCRVVVDLAGLPPVEASNQASTLEQAIAGATKKMTNLLNSTLGRLHSRT